MYILLLSSIRCFNTEIYWNIVFIMKKVCTLSVHIATFFYYSFGIPSFYLVTGKLQTRGREEVRREGLGGRRCEGGVQG